MGGAVSTHMGDVEKLKSRESPGDTGIYGRVIFNKVLK